MAAQHPHEHPGDRAGDAPVLDIGGDVGALVIYTGPDHDTAEIEISPSTDPDARTHNQVHPRRGPAGTVYSAVYPALRQGDYLVWRDADTVDGRVTIHGGRVTEYRWS